MAVAYGLGPLNENQNKVLISKADTLGQDIVADAGTAGKLAVESAYAQAAGEANYKDALGKLQTELDGVRKKFHVETAANNLLYGGAYGYDPTGANIAGAGVDASIRSKVLDRLTEKEAQRYADGFLAGATDISAFAVPAVNPDLPVKFQSEVSKAIQKKVDAQKSLIDTNILDYPKFNAVITGEPNPQLKAAYIKLRNEKFADVMNKEKADTAQSVIQTNADIFKASVLGTETDLDVIADRIVYSPGYSGLPAVVQDVIRARINVEKSGHAVDRNIAAAQESELRLKKEFEQFNVNKANLKLWGNRLKWIGLGALLGGTIATGGSLVLSGGGIAGLSSNFLQIGSAAGAGGLLGFVLGERSSEDINKSKVEIATARTKFDGYDKVFNDLEKGTLQKRLQSLKLLSDMAVLIGTAGIGFEKEAAVKTYLKTANLTGIDEMLK